MNQTAKIVIASVLKPVNDVRMYEKIGLSLAKLTSAELVIMGSHASSQQKPELAHVEWPSFNRLSFARLFVQFRFWKALKRHKPQLIICCTHELLFTAVCYKIFHGAKIVYDVQEDYFKTLWHQTNYPPLIRHLMACVIRLTERVLHPMLNGYFLAERMYLIDMPFLQKKALVLENKSLPIPTRERRGLRFLFTGTLSPYSRTAESIAFYLKLKPHFQESSEMTVIGHCPSGSYYNQLTESYGQKVKLIISQDPIPHNQITDEITKADYGIIGYFPNPVNDKKTPTKLFEYTAAKLPYLVQQNSHWHHLGSELGGAISVDYLKPNYAEIASRIIKTTVPKFKRQGFLWHEQEEALLKFINTIID